MGLFIRPDQMAGPLYVGTAIFNSQRYWTRWDLYDDFRRHVAQQGPDVELYTIEAAFGRRPFVVTTPDNPHHIQVRTRDELWLKENLLNLLVQRLPADWQYFAWVDADVQFVRPDWANEIMHALQHYDIIQPWSEAADMSPQHTVLKLFKSFLWCYHHPEEVEAGPGRNYVTAAKSLKDHYWWHPGFAWAIRREAWDAIGGLVDWAILGGADLFMARALVDKQRVLPKSLGRTGQMLLTEWQTRARKHIMDEGHGAGYIDGTILHSWHGPKMKRRYRDRGSVLVNAEYDWVKGVKRNAQGVYTFEPGNPALRDGIRRYLSERDEDSTTVL